MLIMRKHSFYLIRELTLAEFKERRQSTVAGFLLALLNPLLTFCILYFIFSKGAGKHIEHFTLYLLVGIVQWNYFVNATGYSLRALLTRKQLVKNFGFPPALLVCSTLLSSTLIYAIEMALLVVLLSWLSPGVVLHLAWLPLFIFLMTLFLLGISLVLAVAYVYFRETESVWSIFLRLSIFVTPVFYAIGEVNPVLAFFLHLNPLSIILWNFREVLVYQRLPSFSSVLFFAAVSFSVAGMGYIIFKRLQRFIPEIL